MHAAVDRLEFSPPPTPGLLRALALAVLAHALLAIALAWGIHWKQDATSLAVEAELWSALPQEAAPKPVETPPPAPVPETPPAPPQAAPQVSDADIALEREKDRLKQKQLEAEQQRKDKLAQEKKREQAQREQAKKAAEEKKKKEQDARRKETAKTQEEAKRLEKQRQENIQRMTGLAGATGAPGASGASQQASGPSLNYGGRIRARIRPNIVFSEDIAGNPTAEVEVRTAPSGTIIGRKLLKSSGVKSWDEAVLKAIDKTEVLPRDVDGQVPTTLIISFRPRD